MAETVKEKIARLKKPDGAPAGKEKPNVESVQKKETSNGLGVGEIIAGIALTLAFVLLGKNLRKK